MLDQATGTDLCLRIHELNTWYGESIFYRACLLMSRKGRS